MRGRAGDVYPPRSTLPLSDRRGLLFRGVRPPASSTPRPHKHTLRGLARHEKDVFRLLGDGLNTKEIAVHLGINYFTVTTRHKLMVTAITWNSKPMYQLL